MQSRRRSSNKPFQQQQSPLDTPLREPQFEVRQLLGRNIPSELSLEDTPMREALSSQSQRQSASIPDYSIDDTPVRKGLAAHAQSLVGSIPEHSMDDTPMRDAYHQGMLSSFDSRSQSSISGISPLDMTVDTPMRMHSQITQSAHNISIDTPMRQQQNYRGYPEQYGSPQRQLSMEDTPVRLAAAARGRQRPQSMIEGGNLDFSVDTPMKEAMRSNNQIFYSPPTRHRSESAEREATAHTPSSINHSFTDTPMRQAVSRHGTATIAPQVTSRHGAVSTDQPIDLHVSDSKPRYVTAPYEFQQPKPEQPTSKPAYKLNTPYGTAQNELSPAQTNISLSNAMDAIRTDMMRQHNKTEPPASNQPFGLTSPPSEYPAPPTNVHRVSSAGSSDIDHAAISDVGYGATAAQSPAASSVNSIVTSVSAQGDGGGMMRQPSVDNEDRMSVHSQGSGEYTTYN